jgi:hypothetical protein
VDGTERVQAESHISVSAPISVVMQLSLICRSVYLVRKLAARPEIQQKHGIEVLIHEVLVAGPITHTSLSVAKCLAAEQALPILGDPESESALVRLCNCQGINNLLLHKNKGTLHDKTNAGLCPTLIAPDTTKGDDTEVGDINAISVAARVWSLQESHVILLDGPSEQ